MDKLNLVIILGTKREGNKSQFVARHIERLVEASGDWNIEFIDPNNLNLPGDGNNEGCEDPHFHEVTAKADAFFIIAPEYNHSFPSSLKRMLDSEYTNYYRKAVAIAGVSSGQFGGVRAIVALADVIKELGMAGVRPDVRVANSYDAYNEETGEPKDERIEAGILKTLESLLWMAKTLKYGRENIN